MSEESVAAGAKPGALQAWLLAARPRTLPLAAAPVAVGTAVAFLEGNASTVAALAALAGAMFLQIGSNFANDVFDAEKGADDKYRLGPPRATQQGWLTPGAVKLGMGVAFGLAAIAGAVLVSVAGWPILAIGIAAIIAAITYTGGPWPFGYHGLGEVFVFLFFGVVAVAGTTYAQTLSLSPVALVASVPIGLLASAVLVVNNLRDIRGDTRAEKMTLAVRFGEDGARMQYRLFVLAAFLFLAPIVWVTRAPFALLPLISLPRAFVAIGRVQSEEGAALNEVLAETAQLAIRFALLLAIGLVLHAQSA